MGALLLVLACCLVITGSSCSFASKPISWQAARKNTWQTFKKTYIAPEGRVPSQTFGGAISEGQAYALLMAYAINDRATFNQVWRWTKGHLTLPDTSLLGWQLNDEGLSPDNATDADQDIAYVLLKAGAAWHRKDYTADAKKIIQALWKKNVVMLAGKPYLSAGPWQGFWQAGNVTMAPGYIAPYIYRAFAQADSDHNWQALADTSYTWLTSCSALLPEGFPPNFCDLPQSNPLQAQLTDVQGPQSRVFGYDSIRIFWRLAVDAHTGEAPAKQYLKAHRLSAFNNPQKPVPQAMWDALEMAQQGVLDPTLSNQSLFEHYLAKHYNPWTRQWEPAAHNYFDQAVIWLALDTLSNRPQPAAKAKSTSRLQ